MTESCDYFDIDSILAEEELVPCTTMFSFSHLGHLNQDSRDSNHEKSKSNSNHLDPDTKLKVPIWALRKWSSLQYVSLALPRSYSVKTRESVLADPTSVDLRKRNPHYFLTGVHMAQLLQSGNTTKPEESSPAALQHYLLQSFMGDRWRQILDWSWSTSESDDDVSHFLRELTQLQQSLFQAGASATSAHLQWNLHGSSKGVQKRRRRRRVVTPTMEDSTTTTTTAHDHQKRQRIQ